MGVSVTRNDMAIILTKHIVDQDLKEVEEVYRKVFDSPIIMNETYNPYHLFRKDTSFVINVSSEEHNKDIVTLLDKNLESRKCITLVEFFRDREDLFTMEDLELACFKLL